MFVYATVSPKANADKWTDATKKVLALTFLAELLAKCTSTPRRNEDKRCEMAFSSIFHVPV